MAKLEPIEVKISLDEELLKEIRTVGCKLAKMEERISEIEKKVWGRNQATPETGKGPDVPTPAGPITPPETQAIFKKSLST